MKVTSMALVVASGLLLSACPADDGGGKVLSSGLKIFMTSELHVGDFAADPTLTGANGVEKADDFCNRSAAKPNASTYKALLVDGSLRDAVAKTDWVFKPNTAYYRPYNNVLIDTTNADAIFDVHWQAMDNSIADCNTEACGYSGNYYAWTGMASTIDFSAGSEHCNAWGTGGTSGYGRLGGFSSTDDYAFVSSIIGSCSSSNRAYVYCVEQ